MMYADDLPLPNPMMLPPALQQALLSELRPSETLLWLDQPNAGRMARGSIGAVLFAIPWTAFSIFWMWAASHGSLLFALFGVPFVLIGLGMLTSPIWVRRAAKMTAYALTDKRAIIITQKFRSLNVTSYTPEQLQSMEREQRADDSGSLVFERKLDEDNSRNTMNNARGFLHIEHVKAVEQLILGLIESQDDTSLI